MSLQGNQNWATVGDEDYGVWDGRIGGGRPDPVFQPQSNQQFTNQWGQRCRVVCDSPPRPRPRPVNLQLVARSILGQNIAVAQRAYPNVIIRPVIVNGQHVPTTMDYRQNRINVETRRNIIIRIVSFN